MAVTSVTSAPSSTANVAASAAPPGRRRSSWASSTTQPRPDPINVTRHVDVDERVTDDNDRVPCSRHRLGEVHPPNRVIQSDAQCVQANVVGVLDRSGVGAIDPARRR